MTNKQAQGSVGATIDRYKKYHKIAIGTSISGVVLGLVLEALGFHLFTDNDHAALRLIVQGLIFLPLFSVILGRMWAQGDIVEASAFSDAASVDPTAPPRRPITFTAPAALKVRTYIANMTPFIVLASAILLFVAFGGLAMDAIVSSGAPFETVTATIVGYAAFISVLLVWCIVSSVKSERVLKSIRGDAAAALKLHGYRWAKRDFPLVPGNGVYTDESPTILSGPDGKLSFWSIQWTGENAVMTPVPPPTRQK